MNNPDCPGYVKGHRFRPIKGTNSRFKCKFCPAIEEYDPVTKTWKRVQE